MKILLYTNNLGRSCTNGTAITIMVKEISDKLLERGYDVLIAGNKKVVEESLKTDYVPLIDITGRGGDINYSYAMAKLIKDYQPDIAYAFMRPMSTVLAASTFFYRRTDTVYIGSFHNTDNYLKYGKPVYLPYRWFLKKLLERLDFITGPSLSTLEDIHKTYYIRSEKLKLHPNFINFEKVYQLSGEDWVEEDDYILTIGRLDHQKNHSLLLKVFKRVSAKFPDLKLFIVGDGPLMGQLKQLAFELGIHNKVVFTGYQLNPWKYFRKAKLFVLSSIFEGNPLVLIEAMFFKVPVVSFEIKPVVEITENGKYAILAKAFDEDDFYDKIVFSLKNKEKLKPMVEEGYKKAIQHSPENFIDRMLNFYKEKTG